MGKLARKSKRAGGQQPDVEKATVAEEILYETVGQAGVMRLIEGYLRHHGPATEDQIVAFCLRCGRELVGAGMVQAAAEGKIDLYENKRGELVGRHMGERNPDLFFVLDTGGRA